MTTTVTTSQQLLSEQDVERRYGIKRRTLQTWRRQRRVLPFVKYGALVRYRVTDLENYARTHLVTPYESVAD